MKLRLRSIEPSDMDTLYAFQSDDESIRMAAFTAADPKNREYFDRHWAKILASDSATMLAIELNGQLVGTIGSYDREGEREVTYWVASAQWGRGIASAALQDYLATTERARPLFGTAAADNLGSIRVLEKCGFKQFGTASGFANARGCEIEEVFFRLD